MNAPWPEITIAHVIIWAAAFFAPAWYGAILTVIGYLVVKRRGTGSKMLTLGAITAIIALVAPWCIIVMADSLELDLSGEIVFVVCLVMETMVIIVGAVCCWYRPIVRFRSPKGG